MAANIFELKDRVAFVTGGNSGIGRTLALALKDAGAKVAVGARRATRNAEILRELGDNAAAYEMDVCDEASVAKSVDTVVSDLGRLDILVNNAGTLHRMSVTELERADWDRVMDTNLTGPFLCTKYAARVMRAQGAGKIINIASIYSHVAPSKGLQVAYTAAKHGLIGLTRANAVELAPYGIQVNAIAPGYHATEMNAELRGMPFEQSMIRRTPSGRVGTTADLIGTCLYLASDASNHVTGICITVDGGYIASDGLERS